MRKADRERVSREKRDKISGAPAATAEPGKTAVPAMKEPAVKRALLSGAKREKVAGASGVIGQAALAATLATTPKAPARQEFSQLPSVVAWLLPRQVSSLYLLPANIWFLVVAFVARQLHPDADGAAILAEQTVRANLEGNDDELQDFLSLEALSSVSEEDSLNSMFKSCSNDNGEQEALDPKPKTTADCAKLGTSSPVLRSLFLELPPESEAVLIDGVWHKIDKAKVLGKNDFVKLPANTLWLPLPLLLFLHESLIFWYGRRGERAQAASGRSQRKPSEGQGKERRRPPAS